MRDAMTSLGKWAGIGLALGVIAALYPLMNGHVDSRALLHSLSKTEQQVVPTQLFEGLDLIDLELHPTGVRAPVAGGGQAQLTLDPELQRAATAVMKRYQLPEAGTVVLDVKSGDVLAYASYVNKGAPFDVNARAEAPAASVFKVVTGAALVEFAGLNAESEQCYHGGRSAISASELKDDPERDKWCASLAAAMGRSLNVVFARLAKKELSVEQLNEMAGAFGFGAPVPFEAPNQAPGIDLPEDDPVEFARSAAGFWHSTLSPLAGAVLAQTVANGGVALVPRIVDRVTDAQGTELYRASGPPRLLRRAIQEQTATELTRMMVQTTRNGSARKAFYDRKGRPFIPDVVVAGKTGTLSRHAQNRHYTWFVGFAPAEAPEVAIASLVVNTPVWRIKAANLAQEVLAAYFDKHPHQVATR